LANIVWESGREEGSIRKRVLDFEEEGVVRQYRRKKNRNYDIGTKMATKRERLPAGLDISGTS